MPELVVNLDKDSAVTNIILEYKTSMEDKDNYIYIRMLQFYHLIISAVWIIIYNCAGVLSGLIANSLLNML